MLHVTRHTSHVTRHTSHVTRHTSHVTRHTSHVTRHTSHVIRHTSHVTQEQDAEYRDTISYSARLRESVNRSVVGELEIFLPPSGIPRGGSSEIVITYTRPLAAAYGLAEAIGSDGRSYMLFTNGCADSARCWV